MKFLSICQALLPSLGWMEGLRVSETVVFLCVFHVCVYACVYVYMSVCMCVYVCAHLSLTPVSNFFQKEVTYLSPWIHTPATHGTFCFFFPLLLKTVRLVKAYPFSQSMPFHSCLNSPLLFKFKFLITFWLQGTFSLLNLSSLSSENFLNALLKHY